MSISCEISWEKMASLLQECKTHDTELVIDFTLKQDKSLFLKGRVDGVVRESKSVVFWLDSNEERTFNFTSATSFVLAAGASGTWALSVSLRGQGKIIFASGDGRLDPPRVLP